MFNFIEYVNANKALNLQRTLADRVVKRVDLIEGEIKTLEETDLTKIKGVGEETAQRLIDAGIYSMEDLKNNAEKIKELTLPLLGKKSLEKYLKENG